jgi:uncharacterized membrane protein YbaN (DUF454 family)
MPAGTIIDQADIKMTSGFKKGLYIVSGILSLVLAYIGIIVPGIPGIPFIAVAAYCFTNSSPALLSWMKRQPLLNKLLNKSKKVNRRVFKWLLVSQIWFSVGVAEFTIAHTITSRVLFAAAGIVLSALVLIFLRPKKND